MGEHTEQQPLTEVMSNEPLVIDRPFLRLRRAKIAIALFVAALIVVPAASAYIGYEAGAQRTNTLIAQLNRERATNRATLMQAQANANKVIEQMREAVCVLIERESPDPAVNTIRSEFRCGPYLAPGSPGRSKAPTSAPIPTATITIPAPGPAPRPTARPSPTKAPPTVAPTPPPSSPSPPPVLCLLGICL